ncbi:MAG: 1-(5-phosphoribosyl)-5-[(5-phosphoribosylamino)methylideneamino]imidazole-4-carboxamide isomerase [Anaerolineales bacterium]|nr:1-(5-phosphoribosyl)-5-[(5-phosphoribosylamino)methylideneamino]imidazole-4-carboxamide isomerase [Anaerolineales bacterium]
MFTILPAIDLRQGKVVRLKMGDPSRQTIYSDDPIDTARRWLSAGVRWLHVINLDGAFNEADSKNQNALIHILKTADEFKANVQFGGGLRSSTAIDSALNLGVSRVVLGTIVIEQQPVLEQALARWGSDRVAAGLDAREGFVQVRGWKEGTAIKAIDLVKQLQAVGLRWMVYTDIAQDGMGSGINLEQTLELFQACPLQIIASGGANSLDDIQRVRQAGLAGVIVGQALYSGSIKVDDLFGKAIHEN